MKNLAFLAALLVLTAAPVLADDGNVTAAQLEALGLAGMEVVPDSESVEIRGMSGNAMAMGLSVVSGILVDPATKSFIFGADANAAMSSAENAGLQVLTQASSNQSSSVSLELTVTTDTSFFTGMIIGGAGGSAFRQLAMIRS